MKIGAAYRTIDGDMVDAICFRVFGRSDGMVEALLAANPGLADIGPILPAGLLLQLPAVGEVRAPHPIRLWD